MQIDSANHFSFHQITSKDIKKADVVRKSGKEASVSTTCSNKQRCSYFIHESVFSFRYPLSYPFLEEKKNIFYSFVLIHWIFKLRFEVYKFVNTSVSDWHQNCSNIDLILRWSFPFRSNYSRFNAFDVRFGISLWKFHWRFKKAINTKKNSFASNNLS